MNPDVIDEEIQDPVEPTRAIEPVRESPAAAARRPARRWVWIAALVSLCVGAAGSWVLGARSQSPDQAAARADEPLASWITARVESRVLSATVIQRGQVEAEASVLVGAPTSVDAPWVLTREPPPLGATVSEGDVVLEVSGRPVFVVEGSTPVYRSMRPGSVGTDVEQLQEALSRLGYLPDGDGTFGLATKEAIEAWYRDAGFEPHSTSESGNPELVAAQLSADSASRALGEAEAALQELERGPSRLDLTQASVAVERATRAVDAASSQRVDEVELSEERFNSAVRDRDRLAENPAATPAEREGVALRVAEAEVQLNATRRATDDAVAVAEEELLIAMTAYEELTAPRDATAAMDAVEAARAAEATAQAALADAVANSGPMIPFGEVIFLPSFPARIAPVSSISPASENNATESPLIGLSSGELVVTTLVRANDAELVREGMSVVMLDETTSTEYDAVLEDIADETSRIDGQPFYEAILTPEEQLTDNLVGANLRVTITSASTDLETLVVPLAAVTSAANGKTHVTIVDSVNDGNPREVEIVAGLSADGFVSISPVRDDGLTVGDLAVVGR